MGKTISDVFILTPSELTLLAAGKGITGLISVEGTVQKFDEAEICNAMNHLYQTGMIDNTGDGGYVLQKDLEDILAIVYNAHSMVLIRDFAKGGSFKVIYIGQGIAATEQTAIERDMFRLYYVPLDELTDFLDDDMVEKNKPYRQILDQENIIENVVKSKKILEPAQVDILGNALSMAEVVSLKTERVLKRFVLMQREKTTCVYNYKPKSGICVIEDCMQLKELIIQAVQEEFANDIS